MPHYPKPFFRANRGLWYIQIDGHQHNLGPGSAEDADIKAAELKKSLRDAPGEPSPAVDSRTVIGLIQEFMAHVRANFADDTIEWYRYRLQLFVNYLLAEDKGDLLISEFKPHYVQKWVNNFPDLSPGSKRNYIRAVQRVFNWGEELGYFDRSPIAKMKKPAGGKRERIISLSEYEDILAFTRNECFRDLLVVSWETGCRPQESLIVEARHVDLERCRWFIPKDEAKGRKHDRSVYLNDRALEITRRLMLANPRGTLFKNTDGADWTTDSVNCAFIQLQIRLGSREIEPMKITRQRVPAEQKAAHRTAVAERKKVRHAAAREHGEKYCLYHFRHTWMNRLLRRFVLVVHAPVHQTAVTAQHSANPERTTGLQRQTWKAIPKSFSYPVLSPSGELRKAGNH